MPPLSDRQRGHVRIFRVGPSPTDVSGPGAGIGRPSDFADPIYHVDERST